MGKLLVDFGIKQQLIDRIRGGMPVWGTCAGAILLANQIQDEDYVHLSVMNMEVRRNTYGGQLDSFTSNTTFPDVSKHGFPAVFIRTPIIESVLQFINYVLQSFFVSGSRDFSIYGSISIHNKCCWISGDSIVLRHNPITIH